MKKSSLLLVYLLLCNINQVFADPACVFEWCSAPLPKAAGEKVIGKDNCGNYCSKHGIAVETAPIAPPTAIKPAVVAEPPKEAIAQPAKDLLGQPSISVTLSQNDKGEPVLQAVCPASGFNEFDLQALQAGYHQKVVTRGKESFIVYEK